MQAVRQISVAVMMAALGAVSIAPESVNARTLFTADEPAEFPPLSYKGTQYVDSKGCAYVRSGSGAAVRWVPRVTRDRKVLCGFKPTFAERERALPVIPDPVAPKAPATPQVVQEAAPAAPSLSKPVTQTQAVAIAPATSLPVPSAARPAPVTAAKTVVQPDPALPPLENLAGQRFGERDCIATMADGQLRCSTGAVDYILKRLPAGVTVRTADGRRMTTTEPTMVRVPVKKAPVRIVADQVPASPPVAAPMVPPSPILTAVTRPAPQQQLVSNCTGLSGNAAAYMMAPAGFPVRCGPQAEHPSRYAQRRTQERLSTQSVRRAELAQSAGVAPSQLPTPVAGSLPKGYSRAWDDGRLNPNRGPQTARGDLQMAQVWTETTPAFDPYTPRKRTFWQVLFGGNARGRAAKGQVPLETRDASVQLSTKSVAPARTATRSVAVPSQRTAASGLRYVQVGTFGVPANAERSMARLSAMGLPVATQILHRNGKTLKSVLAGPFVRPEQTLSVLAAVRSAGFGDAYARK